MMCYALTLLPSLQHDLGSTRDRRCGFLSCNNMNFVVILACMGHNNSFYTVQPSQQPASGEALPYLVCCQIWDKNSSVSRTMMCCVIS